jgi:cobalamin biosynthesis protein CobD/CbiB
LALSLVDESGDPQNSIDSKNIDSKNSGSPISMLATMHNVEVEQPLMQIEDDPKLNGTDDKEHSDQQNVCKG